MRFLEGLIHPKKRQERVSCPTKLSMSLKQNMAFFKKELFNEDESIIYREFETIGKGSRRVLIVYPDGLVDKEILGKQVINPLMKQEIPAELYDDKLLDYIMNHVIILDELEKESDISAIALRVLQGDPVIIFDGCGEGIIVNAKKWHVRSVTEPVSESVVRGPREGFNESLAVSLTLVRRRIRSPQLKFKNKEIGTQTRTRVAIGYMEGIASPKILEELEKRLDGIDIDGVLESGYIEELIKDSPVSPFKTIGHTERPDIVAAKLLEGRFAVFVDGTPFVLTLPYIFMEAFQANEDYYRHFALASLDRTIRYVGFFITTSTPAIYLALVTYHQELLPTPLLLSIAGARQGVPFPAFVEVLLMGFVFEILREGGVRLPAPIGTALSIVGAIVLGDAAVNAQLVSAPMIIVVALTGISSFVIPQLLGIAILARLVFVVLAGLLGLYGYLFGVIGLFIHLFSLRSFGIPYMSNTTSLNPQDLKDTAFRAPWWFMRTRPKQISRNNIDRKNKGK